MALALLAGHFGGLTPTKLTVRSAAFVAPASLPPSSVARNSGAGLFVVAGRQLEDEFFSLHADAGQRHRAAAPVEEHPGELAVLLGDLEPVDTVGVLADAGQVPSTEKSLILQCGGGQEDVDEECGGDDGHKAHRRAC